MTAEDKKQEAHRQTNMTASAIFHVLLARLGLRGEAGVKHILSRFIDVHCANRFQIVWRLIPGRGSG